MPKLQAQLKTALKPSRELTEIRHEREAGTKDVCMSVCRCMNVSKCTRTYTHTHTHTHTQAQGRLRQKMRDAM